MSTRADLCGSLGLLPVIRALYESVLRMRMCWPWRGRNGAPLPREAAQGIEIKTVRLGCRLLRLSTLCCGVWIRQIVDFED
jgi:hypothetical protein